MGMMIDGKWDADATRLPDKDGRFVRKDSAFRSFVAADSNADFKPERGRYHLYISYNCPWAHRTAIFRKLKGLDDVVGLSATVPGIRINGWEFGDFPGATPPAIAGFTRLYEAYAESDPHYSGSVTVPVLWDKKKQVIVNNESSEIIRMLNAAFNACGATGDDYYPEKLRAEIDRVNEVIYKTVNNGVYRCGFATTQGAYEEAFDQLFATLDEMDARLAKQRFLVGPRATEADWRFFVTLLRFDPVYYSLFKCNERSIASYANLAPYLRDLYQVPGVAETCNIRHIVRGYYSIANLNPLNIIPKGPSPAGFHARLMAPHDRARLA
jgi:putative glutathione S-transferase